MLDAIAERAKFTFMRSILFALLMCSPAFAETCPPNPEIRDAETDVFRQLQALPNGNGAPPLSGALWALWTQAPDAWAQSLLEDGMSALRLGDYGHASQLLDELIAYCPGYAEGYNQRAFVHYLELDFASALPLLDRAEALSPRHLGVLTGKALTLIGMGRVTAAQIPLKKAVNLNPWLSERALLVEPSGTDL